MSIQAQLDTELKDAMRAKDADLVACIRQLKSKVQETTNAADFKGPVDDALYQRVIGSYSKSLEKGMAELAAGGERGAALVTKYQAEIDYLKKYMPKQLSESEALVVVKAAIAETGAQSSKQSGQVMGAVMKTHKGLIDAGLVKRLVEKELPQA